MPGGRLRWWFSASAHWQLQPRRVALQYVAIVISSDFSGPKVKHHPVSLGADSAVMQSMTVFDVVVQFIESSITGRRLRSNFHCTQHLIVGSGPIFAVVNFFLHLLIIINIDLQCDEPAEAIRYINIHIEIMILCSTPSLEWVRSEWLH